MAAGHQLKKMAQSRANAYHGGQHRWIDYMPRHWSMYTLAFSAASLVLFCFLFYDMQSSPTSLLLHAGRELGALKAQVGESYFSYTTTPSAPSEIVIGVEPRNISDQVSLSQEDLLLIKSEFEDPSDLSAKEEKFAPVKPVMEVSLEEETIVEAEFGTEDLDSASSTSGNDATTLLDEVSIPTEKDGKGGVKVSKDEAAKEDAAAEDEEQNTEDTDIADQKNIEDMIAATDALVEDVPAAESSIVTDSTCDWSVGKWIYDETYPIYKPNTCPYIDGGFRCVENGRPSSEFQKWRWQPNGCDLPRFDAKEMLERLRGKRMVFVGDSIGRNNWESMLCMLSAGVENQSRVYEVNGETISKHSGFLIYRYEDYDCTVEYYRSPHLVPQGRAPPKSDPKVRSTLKLDTIDWSSAKWRTADIVIFNTGHWWSFEKTVRGGNYFQTGQTVHMNMSVGDAFRRAMQTVASYVEKDMDPKKSQVFFRSYAPVHFKGGTWDHGGTCNADTKPLQKFPFVWQDRTPSMMISKVMETNVKNPVNFLNITYLSDLRPDGHSSIWQRVPPSPKNHQDCSHWCLPGVPDTWNEILLATLLKNGKGSWGNQDKLS